MERQTRHVLEGHHVAEDSARQTHLQVIAFAQPRDTTILYNIIAYVIIVVISVHACVRACVRVCVHMCNIAYVIIVI